MIKVNIAEIKKKVDDLAYWGDISPNEVEKDVEYLLSIIEQAEKSLQQVKDWTDNRSEAYGMNANMIVVEALKAIRN